MLPSKDYLRVPVTNDVFYKLQRNYETWKMLSAKKGKPDNGVNVTNKEHVALLAHRVNISNECSFMSSCTMGPKSGAKHSW